jgi:titin
LLGTDISGGVALGNSGDGVTLIQVSGNVISSNVISANAYGGVSISGPAGSGNRVLGNLIGTDITGKIKLGNLNYGVQLAGASNNVVGGAMAGNGNLISGNVLDGVVLTGSGTMGNWVVGNYIGTDRSGTLALGNQGDGVNMGAVSGNVIASNVISANVYSGVDIVGPGASGNVLLGNLIGTDVLGKSKLANLYYGVYLLNANANVVGGPNAGNGNVISGNFQSGIYLVGGGTNEILGNNIGTDSSGTLALGNQGVGMFLRGTTGNNIGGITAGSGNLISANGAQGLFLTNSSWNVIQGNFIGTKADGTNALGNVAHGIDLQVNANSNIIGGAVTGAANHIAWAQTIYAGVRVRPGSQNNLISGNAIFGNGGLGIDLGAYQVNPNVDCENGVLAGSANNGQNYPVLTNVITGAGGTVVRGYLDSAVGETYQLQFFANPTFDPSGYGQGQVYLGSSTLTLGGSCTANFTALLPTSIPVGWMVSATATDPVNDTSEFSEDVPAVSPPGLSIARSGASGDILISYPNLTGPLTLQETFSLLPPVNWVPVTGSLELTNGTYYVSNYAGQTNVFYRLTVP